MHFKAAVIAFALLPSALAAQQLSTEELLQVAAARGVCGDLVPVGARYAATGGTTIQVTCGEATGFVPAVGALGLGGSAAAAAAALAFVAASGGGGATPSTN